MKYKLVKLSNFSGEEASIYSVYMEDLKKTLFDVFLEENKNSFKSELKDILQRIKVIGSKTGAREQFFKLNEGKPGDGVCALYDDDRNLRLYCIRYAKQLVIIGGGGEKSVQVLQDDEKLKEENYLLREISKIITERIKEGEINYTNDYRDFEGNLEFNTEDYE
ncbi:MAG: hypothetical protein FVQ77_09355 [Cytophagales bacterium]|nr:hypothetical protein [Cytophagales bacterium]